MTAPKTYARTALWLGAILACNLAIALAVFVRLKQRGYPNHNAISATALGELPELTHPVGNDSWYPMLLAFERQQHDPERGMYSVFFDDDVKFQYPPSSLLGFFLLPEKTIARVDGHLPHRMPPLLAWSTRLAAVLTVVFSLLVLRASLAAVSGGARPTRTILGTLAALFVLVALTFYPLPRSLVLGQVQVWLNCLVAVGVWCHLRGWHTAAGACFGACCLVKPQFAVIGVWALWRRQWRVAAAGGVVLGVGLGVSIGCFGWDEHVNYVGVLREISRSGEMYWTNQSVNGLLNRLLQTGDPAVWQPKSYAPYHPFVHAATLVTSLLFLGLAWWHRSGGKPHRGDTTDLVVMVAAATLASPVAWGHHYGAFLPLFAATLPMIVAHRTWGRWSALAFIGSMSAVASVITAPEIMFIDRWRGLVGSQLFYGALLFFALAWTARRNAAGAATPTTSA